MDVIRCNEGVILKSLAQGLKLQQDSIKYDMPLEDMSCPNPIFEHQNEYKILDLYLLQQRCPILKLNSRLM